VEAEGGRTNTQVLQVVGSNSASRASNVGFKPMAGCQVTSRSKPTVGEDRRQATMELAPPCPGSGRRDWNTASDGICRKQLRYRCPTSFSQL
jgi:hypothetical protein